MKNEGKKFEEDIKSSVPEDVWYNRYNDGTADWEKDKEDGKKKRTRFQAVNICDCEMHMHPNHYLFEFKSYTGKSITHEAFLMPNKTKPLDERLKKVHKMVDALRFGIHAGYIINMREVGRTFYIRADYVLEHILSRRSKSIPLDYMIEHGIELIAEKRRTRWRYDLLNLFFQIEVRK